MRATVTARHLTRTLAIICCLSCASLGEGDFRGSMAGLRVPLSTLRAVPHDTPRMTRGQCGLLHLHRQGLSPFPCRSPGALLNHLVRAQQQRLRNREAECFRGFEVDHHLELCRLFDRQIAGIGALEYLVNVLRTVARQVSKMRAVRK